MGTVGRTWYQDLTGHRYGLLTVLSFHSKIREFRKWNCRCDCGKECLKYGHQMRAGTVVSCGCEAKRRQSLAGQKNAVDLKGRRFGRLVVMDRSGSNKHQKVTWKCRCDCGEDKILVAGSLLSGNSASCGCIQKEMMHETKWNPDLSQEDRHINRNRGIAVPGVHLWRKDVFSRDGWVCQVCDDKSHNEIVAHHKDGWGICKERRLEVANGVTLCKRCHKEFHDAYGWRNNTEAQWFDFLKIKKEEVA